MHGAKAGAPITTGRYSQALRSHPEFLAAYEAMRDDPALEETRNEIAIARSVLALYLDKYGPTALTDRSLPVLQALLGEISKTVERRQKMRLATDQALTVRHFETVVATMLEAAHDVFRGDPRLAVFLERVRVLGPQLPTGPSA